MKLKVILLLIFFIVPSCASVWIGKDVVFHSKLWWVTWDYPYISDQPVIVGKDYFVVGGVMWTILPRGAVNITIEYYNPNNLLDIGKVAFKFTITPQRPCYIKFIIQNVPNGEYEVAGKGVKYITSTDHKITFTLYVDQPTNVQICRTEQMPVVVVRGKKTSGFETLFSIVGMIATALLLRKKK